MYPSHLYNKGMPRVKTPLKKQEVDNMSKRVSKQVTWVGKTDWEWDHFRSQALSTGKGVPQRGPDPRKPE